MNNWRKEATERYEEHADVHSEANFTALQRALDVAYEAGKIDATMTESIKRYDQAKEDGTLDKHFPAL